MKQVNIASSSPLETQGNYVHKEKPDHEWPG